MHNARIIQIQSFIAEDKPVVLLYNITIRQKEQARNKKCFRFVKVFLQPIRGTFQFDTYAFSLSLTAPGFDRVGRYGRFPRSSFFSSLPSFLLLLAFFP